MERRLRVGEWMKIKGNPFVKVWQVAYAGMPGEGVFSLALNWSFGYHSAAFNMYFPAGQTEIQLPGGRLVVLGVTPEELHCRLERTG